MHVEDDDDDDVVIVCASVCLEYGYDVDRSTICSMIITKLELSLTTTVSQ